MAPLLLWNVNIKRLQNSGKSVYINKSINVHMAPQPCKDVHINRLKLEYITCKLNMNIYCQSLYTMSFPRQYFNILGHF